MLPRGLILRIFLSLLLERIFWVLLGNDQSLELEHALQVLAASLSTGPQFKFYLEIVLLRCLNVSKVANW